MTSSFISDVAEIRRRARAHIDEGAVTEGYKADRDRVITLLNEALATELICVMRYRRHYFMAKGINAESVKQQFIEHSNEEQQHADLIAERISQLGGEPNFNPDGLSARGHSEYIEGTDLVGTIKEDLVAERIAIDTYREIIQFIGAEDPTSRRVLEQILAKEEEHAEELANLLADIDKLSPR